MPVAFLWITLALLLATFIALLSPIRCYVSVIYRKPKAPDFELRISYIHPIIFRYEISSKRGTENLRMKIFGIAVKQGGDGKKRGRVCDYEKKGRVDVDTNRRDGTGGVDSDKSWAMGGENVNVDYAKNRNYINSRKVDGGGDSDNGYGDIHDNVNSDSSDGDVGLGDKIQSYFRSVKSKVNAVKSSVAYKILANERLRGKIYTWALRLLVRFIGLISLNKFKLRAVVGGRDPATVGKIYGYFSAIRYALHSRRYVDAGMEPVFNEDRLEIKSELTAHTTASIILWQISAILATFPYLGVYRALSRKR